MTETRRRLYGILGSAEFLIILIGGFWIVYLTWNLSEMPEVTRLIENDFLPTWFSTGLKVLSITLAIAVSSLVSVIIISALKMGKQEATP